jgi:hypothetical protein
MTAWGKVMRAWDGSQEVVCVTTGAHITYKCTYKSEEVVPCFLHGAVRILVTAGQIVEQFVD